MTLTLDAILRSDGLDPAATQAILHAFVREHEDTGLLGIHADSTDDEILAYTSQQSAKPRVFPAKPPSLWVVFIREGGGRARLWSVLENRGEVSNDGVLRTFKLVTTDHLVDLRNRLVIGWRSPRTWRLNGPTAAGYPVVEIADAQPVPFPGFDRLVLDRAQLEAVMREHRYAAWRTALSSVVGVYLITDTRDGRQYVGKADGAESIGSAEALIDSCPPVLRDRLGGYQPWLDTRKSSGKTRSRSSGKARPSHRSAKIWGSQNQRSQNG